MKKSYLGREGWSRRLMSWVSCWLSIELFLSFVSLPLLHAEMLNTLTIHEETALYSWLVNLQNKSPVGLLESYPEHPSDENVNVKNAAFTYDQALAGIVFLNRGDLVSAKKIFDFFKNQSPQNGLFSSYNNLTGAPGPMEFQKRMGPNAWVGIFALHYYAHTGDPEAYQLARKIAVWIMSLPHIQGGVSILLNNMAVSTENNLSYMAFLSRLRVLASMRFSQADGDMFAQELAGVTSFLKNYAYNPSTGLFYRGYNDFKNVLDVNSWFFLAVDALFYIQDIPGAPASVNASHWGINIDPMIAKIESTFAVQPDGTFGGDVLTARGFDFSDVGNASARGTPLSWIEGTNQMIVVYKMLGQGTSSQSVLYAKKANQLLQRNAALLINRCYKIGYPYTDLSFSTQAYNDDPFFKTALGPSVATTAWVFFASRGMNPLLAPMWWNPFGALTLVEQCCIFDHEHCGQ